jgi:hypothetical protein
MTFAATVLGVEIYRDIWYCENKKSIKMGKTTHFQTLVFPENNFLSIMANGS